MDRGRKWRLSFDCAGQSAESIVRAAGFSQGDCKLGLDRWIAERSKCLFERPNRFVGALLHQQCITVEMQRIWLAWIFAENFLHKAQSLIGALTLDRRHRPLQRFVNSG